MLVYRWNKRALIRWLLGWLETIVVFGVLGLVGGAYLAFIAFYCWLWLPG